MTTAGEIEALVARATKGEWTLQQCGEMASDDMLIYAKQGFTASGFQKIRTIGRVFAHGTPEENEANAALIVAAVNGYADLASRLAAAEGERDALRRALRGQCIKHDTTNRMSHCRECGGLWPAMTTEIHRPGCLAALPAPPQALTPDEGDGR